MVTALDENSCKVRRVIWILQRVVLLGTGLCSQVRGAGSSVDYSKALGSGSCSCSSSPTAVVFAFRMEMLERNYDILKAAICHSSGGAE